MMDLNHLFKQIGKKKNLIQQVQALKREQKIAQTPLKTEAVLTQDETPDRPVPFATVRSTRDPNLSREKHSPSLK